MYNDLFDDFDYDSGQLDGYGYDPESGGYCYDGFVCPDASSMEEAELEIQGRDPKKSRNLIAVLCCFCG